MTWQMQHIFMLMLQSLVPCPSFPSSTIVIASQIGMKALINGSAHDGLSGVMSPERRFGIYRTSPRGLSELLSSWFTFDLDLTVRFDANRGSCLYGV